MPKTTPQNLKDLTFVPEMFQGQSLTTFDAFLTGIINEVAGILEDRIGATRYASTVRPMSDYVKRAEKALCAAELWDRRIITKLSQAKANADNPVSCNYEERQRKHWQDAADLLIEQKIITDSGTDSSGFSSGVVVTEHFNAGA